MKTLDQCVKPVQNYQKRHQNSVTEVFLVSLLLTLNGFHALLWCFYCYCRLWTSNDSWVGFLEAWRFKEKFYDGVCAYEQKQLPGGALQRHSQERRCVGVSLGHTKTPVLYKLQLFKTPRQVFSLLTLQFFSEQLFYEPPHGECFWLVLLPWKLIRFYFKTNNIFITAPKVWYYVLNESIFLTFALIKPVF